jgi:hypothetical protein
MDAGTISNCELDSHADTCVAGANFLACEFNGITCEVVPFTNNYEPMKDIPIVLAATAWLNEETGETVILYFHQILWYGKRLSNSLLNPNQIHHYGCSLCDDVMDKNRAFGIDVDGEFTIPFQMSGTNVFFKSHVPSWWEMDNCWTFVMTHNSTWDPSTVQIASVTSLTHPTDSPNGQVSELYDVSNVYDDYSFMTRVIGAVNIHDNRAQNTSYLSV